MLEGEKRKEKQEKIFKKYNLIYDDWRFQHFLFIDKEMKRARSRYLYYKKKGIFVGD